MDTPEVPQGGPLFLNPEAAGQMDYPGAPDSSQTFDRELELDVLELPGETLPPMGKGPSPGVRDRYIAIARLHAYGYSNNQIAAHLGYSPAGLSLALKKPFIQAEIEKYRAQMFDPDVGNRLKLMGQDAIDYLHRTILDPNVKSDIRSANARWGVEKLTGKPKQEVTHESSTFAAFMEMLRGMHERNEPIEVGPARITGDAPAAAQEVDPWASWLEANGG